MCVGQVRSPHLGILIEMKYPTAVVFPRVLHGKARQGKASERRLFRQCAATVVSFLLPLSDFASTYLFGVPQKFFKVKTRSKINRRLSDFVLVFVPCLHSPRLGFRCFSSWHPQARARSQDRIGTRVLLRRASTHSLPTRSRPPRRSADED